MLRTAAALCAMLLPAAAFGQSCPEPLAAARFIPTAEAQPVDLGWVNGHYYFNVASIGFSAELAGELTSEAKKRFGVLGYAVAAVRVLRKVRPFGVTIEHDGKTERVVTIQVSVGNGRHYGGGMTVEQAAAVDDGNLDFYSLEINHWWRLLALLPALRRGTHGKAADVRAFKTQEIRLTTRKPRPINTDGELTTHTPAHFKVMPKIMRIYAPPPGERRPPITVLAPREMQAVLTVAHEISEQINGIPGRGRQRRSQQEKHAIKPSPKKRFSPWNLPRKSRCAAAA